MEQSRLLLAIVISLVVFLAWQFLFGPKPTDQKMAKKAEAPEVAKQQPAQDKDQAKPYQADSQPAAAGAPAAVTVTAPPLARTITVDTPLYEAKISENGAVIYSFLLKDYRERVEKNSPFKQVLINDATLGIGRLGFAGKSIAGLDQAVFTDGQAADQLEVNDGSRSLTFVWRSPDGVIIEKTFAFEAASYVVGLDITIKNGSARAIQDRLYVGLNSYAPGNERMYAFEGPSALIDNELNEIKTKKLKDQNDFDGNIKWVALQSRYFLTGLVPQQIEEGRLHLSLESEKYIAAEYQQPQKTVQPAINTPTNTRYISVPKK